MESKPLMLQGMAAMAVLIFLAGCSNHATDPTSTQSLTSQSETSSASETGRSWVPPRDMPIPLEVSFTNCRAGITNFEYPESIGPGNHPPSWPSPDPINIDGVSLYMVECGRIAWGPFERGPIHLLFERHNRLNPPSNCTNLDGTDGIVSLWILNSLWVDDQDLAKYLKSTYDLPVVYADIKVSQDLQNGVGSQVWSWNEPDKPASQVTYYIVNAGNSTGTPDTDRMYWYNATTLSYANLRSVPNLDQVTPAVTPGTMNPPMLYAYQGMTTYVGTGQKYDSMELSANLKRYGDFQCQEPLPS